MFQSLLLAGLFLAATPALPAPPSIPAAPASVPAAPASVPAAPASVPAAPVAQAFRTAAPVPVLVASAPRAPLTLQARMTWEVPAAPIAPASPDALSSEEQEFVEKVNAERGARGLSVLVLDPLLVRTARAHSREMCDRDYFDHHSPTPGLTTPMDRFLRGLHDAGGATPDALLVGENIYYCSVFTDVYNVDYGHRALMNSPGHRANILEPRFTKIGLGIYRNARGEFWVTEMFTRDTEY